MNKSTDEDFLEIPRWARVLSDRLYFGGGLPSRRIHLVIEFFSIVLSVAVFVSSFAIEMEGTTEAVRIAAFVMLFFAFLISLQNRTFDRYGLWAGAENAPLERSRTRRGKVVEYAIVFGTGILGIVAVVFFAF